MKYLLIVCVFLLALGCAGVVFKFKLGTVRKPRTGCEQMEVSGAMRYYEECSNQYGL